ncbi:hypothetical protein GCM10029964_116250 [Kibdelosporangium lantanae]
MRGPMPLFLAALLAVALGQPAQAQPVPPAPDWKVANGRVTWTSPRPLTGDAAVEFWADGKSLGRATSGRDHRTFSLPAGPVDPDHLEARAGGRRLDAPDRRPTVKRPPAAPQVLSPAGAVDPGTPGPYQTTTGEYTLDPVRLPGLDGPIEMRGVVVAPKDAHGDRPLVLLLHGRHEWCYDPKDPRKFVPDWPCPAGTLMVPSYRGYLRTQQLLASQGYVTVSISADGVNALDNVLDDAGAQARSSLVRLHLAHWADWAEDRASAPEAVRDAPVADMSNVLLVGHSRGGEGTNRAALDSLAPPPYDSGYSGPVRWTIRGDVFIGPTLFGQNPTPDVPSVTLLPGCDGDVSDLQGQQYIDAARGVSRGTALHSALYVEGTNHNFFNSEWTPGIAVGPAMDDVLYGQDPDPACVAGAPGRLTDAQQRQVGATYVAAAAHLFIDHDQRVQPLLDGSGKRAPSADPAVVLSHALGGARTPVVVPDENTEVTGGRVCQQVGVADACLPGDLRDLAPSFLPAMPAPSESGRTAVDVRWSSPGTPTTIQPPRPVWLFGAQSLALRVIVPPNSTGTSFDVTATDAYGHRVPLGKATLNGLPGSSRTVTYWAQEVRVPVPPVLQVAKLDLTPTTGSGEAWLLDAYGWRPGLPDPKPAPLTRVDLGELQVVEGDSGSRTYKLPATVTGDGGGVVKLFEGRDQDWSEQPPVTIAPGQHTFDASITVIGNTRWSTGYNLLAGIKAVRNTVVGSYLGGVRVTDDDPMPRITVGTSASTVEGGQLTWHARLSEVADSDIYVLGTLVAPDGPELSTTDVDPDWLRQYRVDPLPSRPLSKARVPVFAAVKAGTTSADLVIPTIRDTEAEGTEYVKVHTGFQPRGISPEVDLTGSVTDGP